VVGRVLEEVLLLNGPRGHVEQISAAGATEHAAVDLEGRVRRLPRERVEHLRGLAHRLPDPPV
jgi:hypothetical protein